MSLAVTVTIAVGDDPAVPSLAEAGVIADLAARLGVAALRLTDAALDPTVVAAYLAGRHPGIGYLPEVPTTHQAPYNVARRILSLDRATAGRIGVALLPGDGDEVSDQNRPTDATDPARRWAEYAHVLTRLWESFPREALIGDQENAIVADDTLIRRIDHEGTFYRVAGPLDGPSSVQGRPVIVADLGTLDLASVATSADVIVTGRPGGVDRGGAALFGRIAVGATTDPAALRDWAADHSLDGIELVPDGDVTAVLRAIVPHLISPAATPPPTLRAALGLSEPLAVLA
ncbi:LLM class flavin-dependent oxidoreductase [Actinoplanes subglobosus]|uniref:LLM class flavin-dependent oxidoreductase n=1 Tax=Actinoplanes subglobosus TaxID=1547892 RepID=A0ABV8IYY6_9ACTN